MSRPASPHNETEMQNSENAHADDMCASRHVKHTRTNAFLQAQGNWSMSFWLFPFRDDNEGEGEGEGGFRGLFFKGPDSKQRTPAAWLITPEFRITSKASTIPSPNTISTTPITQHHVYHPLTLQLNLLPQVAPITFPPPHHHTTMASPHGPSRSRRCLTPSPSTWARRQTVHPSHSSDANMAR